MPRQQPAASTSAGQSLCWASPLLFILSPYASSFPAQDEPSSITLFASWRSHSVFVKPCDRNEPSKAFGSSNDHREWYVLFSIKKPVSVNSFQNLAHHQFWHGYMGEGGQAVFFVTQYGDCERTLYDLQNYLSRNLKFLFSDIDRLERRSQILAEERKSVSW